MIFQVLVIVALVLGIIALFLTEQNAHRLLAVAVVVLAAALLFVDSGGVFH